MVKSRLTMIVACFCIVIAIAAKLAVAEIPVQHDDAQILGVVELMDRHVIKEAQLAEQKNINGEVSDYARMLDKGHHQHLEQTIQFAKKLGLTPTDNASLEHLRTQVAQELAELTPLNGMAFEQLYVADMVKVHSESLNWIGNQNTQDRQVKEFLLEAQQEMTLHFKKAQDIQRHQAIGQT